MPDNTSNVKRTIWIVSATVLVGAYLTIPTILFNGDQRIVILNQADIDSLVALDKEGRAIHEKGSKGKEAQQKLDAFIGKWDTIEVRGTPGYRMASQKVIFEKYQPPHFARSIFPWFDQMSIFRRDTDEYLGWLWFTLFFINIAFYAHTRIREKWEDDPRIVACSRWVLFCLGGMGTAMISAALVGYSVPFSIFRFISRVLSGPAHVFDQHVLLISWPWDERVVLYTAIQWVLLGTIGCLVLRRFKGRYLAWNIGASLAGCAILGMTVTDIVP